MKFQKPRAMRRVVSMTAVDCFGGPVGGAKGVEVGEDGSLPRAEGSAEPGHFREGAGGE